jgi:hypothetical protein
MVQIKLLDMHVSLAQTNHHTTFPQPFIQFYAYL